MEQTAAYAAMHGFGAFTTTLSVSSHKSYEMILAIGLALEVRYGVPFVREDFKKGGGALRSVQLAKSHGLYRQTYCGCRYSLAAAASRMDAERQDGGEAGGR